MPWRSISPARKLISSSDGVIRPDSPMMSAPSAFAVSMILVAGTMTPRSMTSKLLHCSTMPTMFLPMSWTSPLTVASTILPAELRPSPVDAVGEIARLFLFHERHQIGDRLLHHARRLHHLRQEHLAVAEEVADDVHAGHQRAFDHVQRPLDRQPRGFGVRFDEFGDAVHQRVARAASRPAIRARPDPAPWSASPCRGISRPAPAAARTRRGRG